ncbi:type IV pilus biogenesis protein PilE [Piscinibacter sakaiensis]|uniref:Type IV pilus biogenesis protein PilE n=2 Tax=Piscinibacter sakaiensis TaxID=1547922 RepID=A0A0K8NWZ9_PISS1|nr:type IV pilus biogenesis protein PilE [Piscinibacter sakaiensis]
MVAVAILAILAAIALPSYTSYVRRGQLQDAFTNLSDLGLRMEQYFQDNRSYANGANCGVTMPTTSKLFTFTCSTANSGTTYTLTATGKTGTGVLGYVYTLNESRQRRTTKFANADQTSNNGCWAVKSMSDC